MTDMNFNKSELFGDCYCQKVLPLVYDNSLSYYEVLHNLMCVNCSVRMVVRNTLISTTNL
jgi:hypothetical protein